MKFLSLANVALMAGLAVRYAAPLTAAGDDPQASQKETSEKVQQAVDPVCGMTVDKKTAQKSIYKGKTYYFCSRDDKQTFEKTPEKYTAKDQGKK